MHASKNNKYLSFHAVESVFWTVTLNGCAHLKTIADTNISHNAVWPGGDFLFFLPASSVFFLLMTLRDSAQ